MQANDDYVLKVLEEIGLVSRKQIAQARAKLNGAPSVVDVLVRDGVVSADDISRSLAAQAQMHWIDLSAVVIPPEIIAQISGRCKAVQSHSRHLWGEWIGSRH